MNGRSVILGVLLIHLSAASASGMTGKVVGVSDGDTITILDQTNATHKIRLADIDAPEKSQPFGMASKKTLSDLCFSKQAAIEDQGYDRYGRIIAVVHCNGIDANMEQVRRGMAWAYIKYLKRKELIAYEQEARRNRSGLWLDENPMPPWDWRHRANKTR